MELFLNNVLRTYDVLSNCILQRNTELLHLELPSLIGNIAQLSRISGNLINGSNTSTILSNVLRMLRNQLLLCRNYLSNLNEPVNETIQLPVLRQGGRGRPKTFISVSQVRTLDNLGVSSSKIAKFFNISRKTLQNFKCENHFEDTRAYNTINDQDLHATIAEIIREHPFSGYRYVWAHLKCLHIFVPRHRVISLLRQIDPIGLLNRKRRKLRRRQYKVKGANYLWHMDGNEKLVPWNTYIHGCVDGFSRRIIYLKLCLTKVPQLVLQFFTEGVLENGLPMRVRGDHGTENVQVKNYMNLQWSNIQNPFIPGKSVHNVRVERMWGEVNRVVSIKFRNIFRILQERNVLSQLSMIDLLCLWYVYIPRIQKSLFNFQLLWNQHSMSTKGVNHCSPNQLWFTSLLQLSHEEHIVTSRLAPEHLDFNPDFTPESFRDLLLISNLGLSPDSVDYFIATAVTLVPDPSADDSTDGMTLYQTLRNHFINE